METQEETPATGTKLTIEGMLKVLTLILLVKVTYEGIKKITYNLKTNKCIEETNSKLPQSEAIPAMSERR